MDIQGIKETFDKMEKKQKTAYGKTHSMIENMIKELENSKQMIQNGLPTAMDTSETISPHENLENELSVSKILADLKIRFNEFVPSSELSSLQKEVFTAATKCGKLLDKYFCTEISRACRDTEFEEQIVNEVIAQYLYRQGMFELADSFLNDAGMSQEVESLKAPFTELYKILNQIRDGKLEPALQWAGLHREALTAKQYDGKCSLEFQLHSLQFLTLLRNYGQEAALHYARTHFGMFASHHMADIQRLMGALLWANRLESSPYSDLFSCSHLDSVISDFKRQFCTLMGQPSNPPLHLILTAGSLALPSLLKIAAIMATKKLEWQTLSQLPTEIEIGKEFQFHSMFACPVSREQSTAENPPMLMPCGHVLCKQSILKLGKGNSRSFKCPYCPLETTFTLCKQIHF